jgi:hypothetical protein
MRLADVLQIVGAILILTAYLLAQFRSLSTDTVFYLGLNAVGGGILAGLAASSHLWGFLLLEFVWSVVAVCALAARAVRHRAAGRHPGAVPIHPPTSPATKPQDHP